MKLYTIARANNAIRPENLLGMTCVLVKKNLWAVESFKVWHLKRLAQEYLDDFVKGQKYLTAKDYKIITLESK